MQWMKKALKSLLAELLAEAVTELEKIVDRWLRRAQTVAPSAAVEYFGNLSGGDLYDYGKALDELSHNPHYKFLVELVKRRRSAVGEMVLNTNYSADYLKGFRDGAESLDVIVNPIRKHAEKLEQQEKKGAITIKDFLGLGGGAL